MYPFIFSIIWYFDTEKRKDFGMTFAESIAEATKNIEKLGFEQVGRRPRYYHNPREDALILRKELTK